MDAGEVEDNLVRDLVGVATCFCALLCGRRLVARRAAAAAAAAVSDRRIGAAAGRGVG